MTCRMAAAAELFRDLAVSTEKPRQFRMLLLPTPELPVKATVLPRTASCRAATPSPLAALVGKTGNPAWR